MLGGWGGVSCVGRIGGGGPTLGLEGRPASPVLVSLAERSRPLCLEGGAASSELVSLVQGCQPLGSEGGAESCVLF